MTRILFQALVLVIAFTDLAHGHGHSRHHHARHYQSASGGRPGAWCGWYMLGRHPNAGGRELYLARNWARVGHATSPHVGAIVVWSHHVGEIVGGSPGAWIINSGNDGHAVRTRQRSIAGAIAFRDL
jgi:hypothetical protein